MVTILNKLIENVIFIHLPIDDCMKVVEREYLRVKEKRKDILDYSPEMRKAIELYQLYMDIN